MTTRSKAAVTPSNNSSLPPDATTQSKKKVHFPGDPRYEISLSVTDEDVTNLRENKMLRQHLLDFLIQQAAPTATTSEDKTDANGCTKYLAGLGVKHYIQESNTLLSDMKRHARKIQRIRGSVRTIATNKRSIIIFPIIESHHFYVLVVQIALFSRSLYERVHCYDSLRHSERGRGQKVAGTPEQQQFLDQLNTYIMNFIFHENEERHQPSSTLSSQLEFRPCPGQANVIDCGLFSVGVVLHLLANLEVESNIFNQANISHLRNLLGCFLHNRSRKVPSSLIRNCFPRLKGTSVLDQDGVEEVDGASPTGAAVAARTRTSATASTSASATGTPAEADEILDLAMETILRDSEDMQVFQCLDDVNSIVSMYENQTGNRLRIHRSERNKYRLYRCTAHVNCTYEVLFGRRRLDGTFKLKRIQNKHGRVHSASRARDGRRLKERRAGRLDNIVVQVLKTKKDPPIPADIVKTAATSYGEVVPYSAAYRALNVESKAASEEQKLGFQLIIPYLEKFKEANAGSFVSYVRNEDLTMKSLCLFPSFMNDSLKFVRPIISLDATHLKSKYKGILLVATVLSATNELYPLGFMISSGNEDLSSWTEMLTALKEACPRIATETDDTSYYAEGMVPGLKFAFISDRDKGLKGAMQSIFPNNVEINCAKHIEANVGQRGFGQQCARLVFPLARTFSTLREAELLGKMRSIKPAAATYVLGVNNGMWRGTSWMDESHPLPPRYGILTSNSSESVNSMLADARELGWLEAVEKILDVMSTKISQRRQKHKQRRGGNELVVQRVTQVLNKSWDDAASMDVFNLEDETNEFKVVDNCGVRPAADENRDAAPLRSGQRSTHILKPGRHWCSCGLWQEYRYPCVHACAYFRKWMEYDLQYVLQSEVDDCHSYSSVHGLFTRNIVPVVLDSLSFDGETKPPLILHRTAGRPKLKRIRRRSELAEESRVSCSICGKRGHNRRTCKEEATLTALVTS